MLPTRVPAILADYACARTMACCHAPWKATLQEDEKIALPQRTDAAAGLLRAYLVDRGGTLVLRQPGGACGLLDREQRGCKAQIASGLEALPGACRNFPRSVVALPTRWEMAYTLACPTVATLVAGREMPFAWAELHNPQYLPWRTVADRVPVSRAADWTLAEVDALRHKWWHRLANIDSGVALAQLLADLQTFPLLPDERSDWPVVWQRWLQPWTTAQVQPLTQALTRFDTSGELHATWTRQHWAVWLSSVQLDAQLAVMQAHLGPLTRATALVIQQAGLHDAMLLGAGMHRAAQQMAATVRILSGFIQLPLETPVRDALVAGAHVQAG